MKPLISIITPTYNQATFLDDCIQSVINQSFKNWELLLINDNSTDNTKKILQKWCKKDNRIKVTHLSKRIGIWNQYKTYNLGLKKAKGAYIALLDSDNYWPKDKLKKQLEKLQKTTAILSFGDVIYVTEKKQSLRIHYYRNPLHFLCNTPPGSILHLFSNLDFYLEPNTVMIKKKALVKIDGFQKSTYYPFTDLPTWLKLSLEGSFFYHNEVLAYYRKQRTSSWFSISSKTPAMMRENVKACFQEFLKTYKTKIQTNNIYLNKHLITSLQKNILQKNIDEKPLTLLLHQLAFHNKENVEILIDEIKRKKEDTLIIRCISLLIYCNFAFIYVVFMLSFFGQELIYMLHKKTNRITHYYSKIYMQ